MIYDLARVFLKVTNYVTTIALAGFVANGNLIAEDATHKQIIKKQPNIVLVMADDQGWGQAGYNNHPILKTPNLDAMASNGLRFNRFYAGGPVCSPTRASVLTGRSHCRTGVESHGFALRLQEKTIAQTLQGLGYATGHFGKWHLNGMRGPGVPILAGDSHGPGTFGFDKWLSVTNFFDRDPVMGRQGEFEEFKGDSSEIIVDEALKFISKNAKLNRPSFTVIWFGTPHNPFMADPADAAPFADLDQDSRDQHGELVAMDRSIGTLRKGLRGLGIENETIVWFTSDNGGLPKIKPETVGGLRGFKGSLYEGGIRVPTVLEWPTKIAPRITDFPAVAMDIVPTIGEILGVADSATIAPQDGISLVRLFNSEIGKRPKPIPFSFNGSFAIIDNSLKLLYVQPKKKKRQTKDTKDTKTKIEMYDLVSDPHETVNLIDSHPKDAARMIIAMKQWQDSLATSVAGKDYPEGIVTPGNPEPRQWTDLETYRPFFEAWKDRPEYRSRIAPKLQPTK